MRTYRVAYGGGEWEAEDGETIDLELTPLEEKNLILNGRITLEPIEYEVTGSSSVFETGQGETVSAAIPLEQEIALIAGGHIKHADDPTYPAHEPTKAEMLETAKARGLEVKSSMTKDEIAEALAADDLEDDEEGGSE